MRYRADASEEGPEMILVTRGAHREHVVWEIARDRLGAESDGRADGINLSDVFEPTLPGESKGLDKSGPNVLPGFVNRAVFSLEIPAGILALPPENHVFECAPTPDAREIGGV